MTPYANVPVDKASVGQARAAGYNTVIMNKGITGNQLLSDPVIKLMAVRQGGSKAL